jgi:hypothetical protein
MSINKSLFDPDAAPLLGHLRAYRTSQFFGMMEGVTCVKVKSECWGRFKPGQQDRSLLLTERCVKIIAIMLVVIDVDTTLVGLYDSSAIRYSRVPMAIGE